MMEVDLEVHHREVRGADRRASHHGGFPAGAGNCGGGLGSRHHHGSAGRSQGGRSASTWPRPWWARFWAFCCATASSDRWPPPWANRSDAEANYFGFSAHGGAGLHQRAEPDDGGGTGAPRPFPTTSGRPFRKWKAVCRGGGAVASRRHNRMLRNPNRHLRPRHQPRPIIIIKKKKAGHGGHHGGAWKVAYADFVTAMMALFIVLWLMSADEKVKEAVSAYFNNPTGPGKLTGTAAAGAGQCHRAAQGRHGETAREDPAGAQDHAQLQRPERPRGDHHHRRTACASNCSKPKPECFSNRAGRSPTESGAELLTRLAEELGKLPNHVLIEGHTDSKPFAVDGTYSNWELSTDRANSARKLMEAHGLRHEQVDQVRGFADRQLRHPEDPETCLQPPNLGDRAIPDSSTGAAQGPGRSGEGNSGTAEGPRRSGKKAGALEVGPSHRTAVIIHL